MIRKRFIMILCGLALLAGAGLTQAEAIDAAAAGVAITQHDGSKEHASDETGGASMGLLFFVFVLAIFLGAELIAKVPSQLHTPLMSGSNAISGISIVGAMLALTIGNTNETMMIVLGTLAVTLAMINVVGGYLVTDRMLGMFRQKKENK